LPFLAVAVVANNNCNAFSYTVSEGLQIFFMITPQITAVEVVFTIDQKVIIRGVDDCLFARYQLLGAGALPAAGQAAHNIRNLFLRFFHFIILRQPTLAKMFGVSGIAYATALTVKKKKQMSNGRSKVVRFAFWWWVGYNCKSFAIE